MKIYSILTTIILGEMYLETISSKVSFESVFSFPLRYKCLHHSSFHLYPNVALSRFLGICHPLHYPPHTRCILSLILLLCQFFLDQLATKFQKILVLHSPCSRRINPCQYTKGGENNYNLTFMRF